MFDLETTLQVLNALERDGILIETMEHLRPDIAQLLAAKNQRRQQLAALPSGFLVRLGPDGRLLEERVARVEAR